MAAIRSVDAQTCDCHDQVKSDEDRSTYAAHDPGLAEALEIRNDLHSELANLPRGAEAYTKAKVAGRPKITHRDWPAGMS